MGILLENMIILLLVVLGIPLFFFVVECAVGCLPNRKKSLTRHHNLRAAILVPAHNEEAVITDTLENLKQHIEPSDLVVVIADNCTDKTATLVNEQGFTALERHNDTERGKGYALDFGMQYLRSLEHIPDMVIIVDADCLLERDALDWLKQGVAHRNRPVQACYLMKSGTVDRMNVKVSEFAFMVKNKIRLRGLSRLGMPVPLTGTGMAFPWHAIASANMATGDIVEDMRLGVELVEKGMGASYCDQAKVTSFFPTSEKAEQTQRERWEHGHLSTLTSFAPRLLKQAITKLNIKALGMMLDLIIPPLSLLVMLVVGLFGLTLAIGLSTGHWLYSAIVGGYLLLLGLSIFINWLLYGRQILGLKQILHIPVYIVSKVVIYITYAVRKQTKWIRTDRH